MGSSSCNDNCNYEVTQILSQHVKESSDNSPSYDETTQKTPEMSAHMSGASVYRTYVLEPRDYIPPMKYEVYLPDVTHDKLVGQISEGLEITYLSEQIDIPSQKNIEGILFGSNHRPMINLVISSKKYNKNINIIFMIDTTSPCLYLSRQAIKALGYQDPIPSSCYIHFEGIIYEAYMSPSTCTYTFSDINLIGASFLNNSHAKMCMDYSQNSVTLQFS